MVVYVEGVQPAASHSGGHAEVQAQRPSKRAQLYEIDNGGIGRDDGIEQHLVAEACKRDIRRTRGSALPQRATHRIGCVRTPVLAGRCASEANSRM